MAVTFEMSDWEGLTDSLLGLDAGLSQEQLDAMKARMAAGNQGAQTNALQGLASNYGGDTSDPRYAMLAARMKGSAAANTASGMAGIEAENLYRMQEFEMQKQSLLNQLTGMQSRERMFGADLAAQQDMLDKRLKMQKYGIDTGAQTAQQEMALKKAQLQMQQFFGVMGLNNTAFLNRSGTTPMNAITQRRQQMAGHLPQWNML